MAVSCVFAPSRPSRKQAGNADELIAWVSAEVNFMDPRSGVTIVHGVKQDDDPERYAALLRDMERDTSAWDMGAAYAAHMVINPVDTRQTLTRLLEIHRLRLTGGVGQHLMRTWPTSY